MVPSESEGPYALRRDEGDAGAFACDTGSLDTGMILGDGSTRRDSRDWRGLTPFLRIGSPRSSTEGGISQAGTLSCPYGVAETAADAASAPSRER